MTEQDRAHLEWLYTGFAMMGYLINGEHPVEEIPHRSKELAKAMMTDTEELGIMAIKPRKKYSRKGD
jgi:hypothetical protein